MRQGVFEAVKVADFGWAVAGPQIAKTLADYGASVIQIESNVHYSVLRTTPPYKDGVAGVNRSGYFASKNTNKYGVSLNLKNPQGLAIARKIMAWADVVCENFKPGVMKGLGLGYEDIRQMKPEIIMLSTSGQGQTGPQAANASLGMQMTALAGFVHLTGWPDRSPAVPFGAYTDVIGPRFATVALIAALEYRNKTGKGQYLELSQYEASVEFLAPEILDCEVNGRVANRTGNRCADAAPHGIYPCLGKDRWCAIAVFSDVEWAALRQVLGNPDWAANPKFSNLPARKQNEDELDAELSKWTEQRPAVEVMRTLQSSGINAGVVQSCEELEADVQLRHRHHYPRLKHPELIEYNGEMASYRLSRTPAVLKMPAPCLGEHNELVCTGLLGMSDAEFLGSLRDGAFE